MRSRTYFWNSDARHRGASAPTCNKQVGYWTVFAFRRRRPLPEATRGNESILLSPSVPQFDGLLHAAGEHILTEFNT
jgi:hypothetical protein